MKKLFAGRIICSFSDVELEKILDQLAEWYGFTVFYENADVKQEKFFRVDKYAESVRF
ncbi:MAG: DUF4974 domain-containing protein [Butyricimonas faecalis]